MFLTSRNLIMVSMDFLSHSNVRQNRKGRQKESVVYLLGNKGMVMQFTDGHEPSYDGLQSYDGYEPS